MTHKRTVLKLAFEDRITYSLKNGLRTPKTTLPFKMLAGFGDKNVEMVEGNGATSNRLFEILEEWESIVEEKFIIKHDVNEDT